MWPEPKPVSDKLYGNLEELRRTAAFVRATGYLRLAYDDGEEELAFPGRFTQNLLRQALGVEGLVVGLAGPVSVYCERVREKVLLCNLCVNVAARAAVYKHSSHSGC